MSVAAAGSGREIPQNVLGLPVNAGVEETAKPVWPRERRADADIARTVRLTLEWDPLLSDRRIRSAVSEGWVSLEGEVLTLQEREDAERLVRVLAGVKGVRNLITVAATEPDPQRLREAIEETLELEAEREAEKITVRVDGGLVTLGGRVRTWQEKSAVLGTVSHAPGVRQVKDLLSVSPRD